MSRVFWSSVVLLLVAAENSSAADVGGAQAATSPERAVVLHVRMLQVDRTQLQLHASEVDADGRLRRLEAAVASTGPATSSLAIDPVADEAALNRVLDDWRERLEVLTIMAEPTIVTLDGEEAEFLAGGWLDVPVPAADGTFDLQKWRLGFIFDCRPVIVGPDQIKLDIACKYRRADPTRAVTINQVRVPTISNDFDIKLTAQVKPGQANIIRGLSHRRVVDGSLVETESILIYKASFAPEDATGK